MVTFDDVSFIEYSGAAARLGVITFCPYKMLKKTRQMLYTILYSSLGDYYFVRRI